MDAVGARALDEIGPVVQHEKGAMRGAGLPERLSRPDELVVRQLLVAELHDVDAAAQRRLEECRWIVAARPRLEDEIEPRAGEAGASGDAVHGGGPYRPPNGAV